LAIINIQQEKTQISIRTPGIEGTKSLSSRCPSTVKLALLLTGLNSWR